MEYTFGFIGCGNMGGALVRAVAKTINANNIRVYDSNPQKTQALANDCGVKIASAGEIALNSSFIVLGVKPQNIFDTIAPIQVAFGPNIVVTMAAGISMTAIRSFIGRKVPIIRIMPNTPALVGEGMILYDCLDVSPEMEKAFLHAFSGAGKLDKIPEEKIDAASALSGCGPAFVYAFAEALADGAVECGVPRDKAAEYAAQTLYGAAKMLLTYGHPADLKDAVCSPGGTTIAGIHALEHAGFRGATMDAITAAYKRTLELKK